MNEQHDVLALRADSFPGSLRVMRDNGGMSDGGSVEQAIQAGQLSMSFHLLRQAAVGMGEDCIGRADQPPSQACIAQICSSKMFHAKRRPPSGERFHAQTPVNKGSPIHGRYALIITGCVES